MKQKGTLHILNGMEMYKYFNKIHFLEPELKIPFNEAVCYGNTCEDIFSDEFIVIRSHVHHVTPEQYAEITLKPLQPFFRQDFNQIALWFDHDMFCQINLLTILAYLDRVNYKGEIELHLVDDNFQPENYFTLKANGYYALYKQVLIHKRLPQDVYPSPLKSGIELYVNYLNKESDFMLYIERHKDVPINELVFLLMNKFRELGLGDIQYYEIIKSHRNQL